MLCLGSLTTPALADEPVTAPPPETETAVRAKRDPLSIAMFADAQYAMSTRKNSRTDRR